MKKVLAIAVLGVLTLASCKKDYTCECTSTNGSASSTSNTTLHATKKDATTACEASNVSSGSSSISCKIK